MKFSEELGFEIPERWEIQKVSDLGEIITGRTPSTKNEKYWGGSYPFITPTDLEGKKYVEKVERKVTEEGLKEGNEIPENSIMVVCIASIGEVSVSQQTCITNQQINTLVCEKDRLLPSFGFYLMKFSKPQLERYAGVTTTPIINKSKFGKIKVGVPPISEQQKIAEILGTVDDAIQKSDEIIEKTKRLKKGLMHQLLTRGIGHKEFKFSEELGFEIPEEWNVETISNLFKVVTGTTPSTKKDNFWEKGDVDWFTPADMTDEIRLLKGSSRKITERALRETSLDLIPSGSLLMSTRAPVGYVALLGVDATFNQGCKGLVPLKDEVAVLFYLYYLSQQKYHLNRISGGSTFNELGKRNLQRLKVVKPPLKEQQKIAEILGTVDKKIELEKERKTKFERIKDQLMHDLLTGKRRVVT